jgi:hypothetical protein
LVVSLDSCAGWWYELGAIRKSAPKSAEKGFDLASWLMSISSKAAKTLFEANLASSTLDGVLALEAVFTCAQHCAAEVRAVLAPTSSEHESIWPSLFDLEQSLLSSELQLLVDRLPLLSDMICKQFQLFLSALSCRALSDAHKHLLFFTRSLPLISAKTKLSTACEEVDAMDSTGTWYQAFVVSRTPKSALVHFRVSNAA